MDEASKNTILALGTEAEKASDEVILKGLPNTYTFCQLYTGVRNHDEKVKTLSKNLKDKIQSKLQNCFLHGIGARIICKTDGEVTL